MNDWTALFRSLTADTLDSVDTLSAKRSDEEVSSTSRRYSVNSVQSVNVSKGEEEEGASLYSRLTGDIGDNGDNGNAEAAISSLDRASLFSLLTADTLDSVDTQSTEHSRIGEDSTCGRDNVNTVQSVNVSKGEEGETGVLPLAAALTDLERRCPDHIEAGRWQHAVEDGRRFLVQWGAAAEHLGWTAADIFGLPPVPPNPHPSWQRLTRIDQLGLVWLTHGRPVTSITAESATIATPSGGSVAFYRRSVLLRR
jgi:hypothetical protein